MKKYVRSSDSSEFTTFLLKSPDAIFASHQFATDYETRQKFSDRVFQFIDEAYDELGGFRSFKDMDRFINDSYLWYITYKGKCPADGSINIDNVYVVSVYRRNHGLKMVGMARRKVANLHSDRRTNMIIRQEANAALTQHIKFSAKVGWAEVSDKLEKAYMRTLGVQYVIEPELLQQLKIFDSIDIDIDECHYFRPLRKDGPILRKIAFGTIQQ